MVLTKKSLYLYNKVEFKEEEHNINVRSKNFQNIFLYQAFVIYNSIPNAKNAIFTLFIPRKNNEKQQCMAVLWKEGIYCMN